MYGLQMRRPLSHQKPWWVGDDAIYFITVNALPRGRNHLCVPTIADAIWESIDVYESKDRWWMHLALLMPDHVHMLTWFAPDWPMDSLMPLWKRYLSRTRGIDWQERFTDHRIRSQKSMKEKAEYILQNPVRAGLVERAEDWPYVRMRDLPYDARR